jgi:hypothetical protein
MVNVKQNAQHVAVQPSVYMVSVSARVEDVVRLLSVNMDLLRYVVRTVAVVFVVTVKSSALVNLAVVLHIVIMVAFNPVV